MYISIPQADFRGHIRLARVGIGFAMATYDPNITIQFSRACAQGSSALQRIALNAMQYNKDRRSSAAEIYNRVRCIQQWMPHDPWKQHRGGYSVNFGIRLQS